MGQSLSQVIATALGSGQLDVVGKGNLVEQRVVALGPTDGDLVTLTDGIKEGDRIISGNLQKIFPGAAVQPLDAGGG